MDILLIILGSIAFNWAIVFLYNFNKNKQLKRDEDLFLFKIEQILKNSNISQKERIEQAKFLCLNTKGKIAAGSYLTLELL